MAAKSNLPTPKSRSHQDPSNKTPLPPVNLTITVDAGDAICTIDAFGSLRGIPRARLSGGAHVDPIYPLSATMSGLGVIRLHYAEAVANGDFITWPEKDEAIRNRVGGYVGPIAYEVGGTGPTNPVVNLIQIDSDAATATIRFDQDMVAAGPSIAGQVILTDPDGVQWETLAITGIAGNVVSVTLRYSVQASLPGTSTTMAIGTVLVGLVGALPADEWADFVATWIPAVAAPYVIHAINNTFNPGEVDVSWNVAVTDGGNTHKVIFDDGILRQDNTATSANFSPWQTFSEQNNAVGPSTDPNTVTIEDGSVVGAASGLPNAQILNFPCPDEP